MTSALGNSLAGASWQQLLAAWLLSRNKYLKIQSCNFYIWPLTSDLETQQNSCRCQDTITFLQNFIRLSAAVYCLKNKTK